MIDPDHWYESHADDLAGAECDIVRTLETLLLVWSTLDLERESLQRAASPLGRYSSGFPDKIQEIARTAWQRALEHDGLEDSPMVTFSGSNPWPARYDHLLRIAKSLGISIRIR